MSVKVTRGERIFRVFNTIFMILMVLVTFYPFYHVLMASFSNPSQIARHTGLLMTPKGFSLEAYMRVWENPNIGVGYKNTLIYVGAGTAISMVVSILSSFVLSRKNLYWKNVLSFFAAFTMFFSGGLIPFYLQVQNMGIANTRWAILLPAAISTYNVIVLRTAFASIPQSLEESARIDGANDFVILFRIILPLSIPTLVVILLFYSVSQWNSWFNAMIFLRDRELYPLQLFLREILVLSDTSSMMTEIVGDRAQVGQTIKYATIIFTTIPILLVYPFLQRYFIKGMMIGAVKE